MIKIAFCGSPGSAKTTTAQNFASTFRYKSRKKIELITEYARTYVSTFGNANIYEQYLISHKQIDLENSVSNADYIITDSPAFMGLIYAQMIMDWHDKKQKHFYSELFNVLLDNMHSYRHLFYFLPIEEPSILDDGKRIHKDLEIIKDIDYRLKSFLKIYNIDFIEVIGSLDERVNKCLEIVLGNNR